MKCSLEKQAANRQNASRSTGPKTIEGKAISRRNGLKHGMTGQGIVLPDENVEAVTTRFARLKQEMRPTTELSLILVNRIATLSVKLERSAEHEGACLSELVRTAIPKHDEAIIVENDRLIASIQTTPRESVRQLLKTPSGVKRLIESWWALRENLSQPGESFWGNPQWRMAENLTGRPAEERLCTRLKALTCAVRGEFGLLNHDDAPDLPAPERKDWARGQLLTFIDAQIALLADRLANLDHATVEASRAEAPKREKFDASPNGILARKYEAANSRELYKAIDRFSQVETQAETDEAPQIEPEPTDVTQEPAKISAPVASSFPAREARPQITESVARPVVPSTPSPSNPSSAKAWEAQRPVRTRRS